MLSTLSSQELDDLIAALADVAGIKGIPDLSLKEFIVQAWPILEPGTPFIDNWHIDALCEHLSALSMGTLRKLVINMPPRCMKSLCASVAWPMWTWGWWPESRWLYYSYAESLALVLSEKCRVLVNSPWYRAKFGTKVKIRADQNAKGRFENTRMGFRLAAGVGGISTGDGGDFIVCLPYESEVTTKCGRIPIGDIVERRIAADVLTVNHETGETEWQPVLRHEQNPPRPLVEIDLGDRTLVCTEDHPVYVEGKGYVKASDVVEGDVVLTEGE